MRGAAPFLGILFSAFSLALACGGDKFEPSSASGGSGNPDGGGSGGATSGGGGSGGNGGSSASGGSGGTNPGGGGSGGGKCGSNEKDCDGVCVETSSNVEHCGGCDPCPAPANGTATCSAGVCGVDCTAPYENCDGKADNGCEVSTDTDPKHCNACNSACPQGANATPECKAGVCGLKCTGAFDDCDSNAANGCEIDTSKDAKNCGVCGQACPAAPTGAKAQICATSKCACESGLSLCAAGSGQACVATDKDPKFCGASCAKCPDGQGCSGGTCFVPACAYGQIKCPGDNACHNLASDWANCGTCGNQCDYDETCTSSVCLKKTTLCAPGKLDCGDWCTDAQTDSANCGSCNVKCAAGQACLGGACKALPLAAEPWECASPSVACNIPTNWPVKPASYYCWTSCVFGGNPVPAGG
ncbi:MAG: hypothetical protein IPM35_03440 [Myxococcales bacterium]|nr:hypothetical protein [Myxococcales bacterium]